MDVRGGGQAADERHVQRANGYDSDGEEEGARGKPGTTGDTADVTGIGVGLFRAWEGAKPFLESRVRSKPGTPHWGHCGCHILWGESVLCSAWCKGCRASPPAWAPHRRCGELLPC